MARIWIGDSRGVGMESAVGTGTDTWIVKGAMSYNWFKNTALPETKTKLSSNPVSTVIIMMGVNDCANPCVGGASTVESYISDVNALVSTYPLAKIYFCAVNPVDGNYPSSYHSLGYIPKDDLNATIRTFNSKVQQSCRAKYLDTYNYLIQKGFSTSDGIHYTSDTYKKLHSWICESVLTGQSQVVIQYQPRTSCPDKDDVWYINTSYKNSSGQSGRNKCILGNYPPVQAALRSLIMIPGSVLPNCFAGETEFITWDGIKTLQSCEDEPVKVLCKDQKWRWATVRNFGKQVLWELHLSNGNVYWPTANHRWYLLPDGVTECVLHTEDLKPGMFIPLEDGGYVTVTDVYPTEEVEDVYCVLEPITKSFTLAGGEITGNCVGYAWGRFSEILGEPAKLSASNAENWWAYTSDGYERGQTPRLGAVMCWQRGATLSAHDGAGHVAIVEQINDDGSIKTGESGWGADRPFYMNTRTNSNGRWGAGSDYTFQGFIYNPKAGNGFQLGTGLVLQDSLYYFLEEVNKHIGEATTLNSAQYVKSCAEAVGNILDTVISNAVTPRDIAEQSVKKEYGKWLIGPANIDDEDTEPAKPYPGDLALIRTVVKERDSEYSAERIAVVTSIIDEATKFKCVYANTGSGKVVDGEYRIDSNLIAGYYRPHWELIGASVLHLLGYAFGLSVYTEISGKDDATLREVSYLNSQLEPSIISSNLKLSVINYTSGISALFLAVGATAPVFGYTGDLILDNLDQVPAAIVAQLVSYGLNGACAIGIIANIKNESGFRPDAVGDGGTSFGLCQWHLGRGDRMKAHCGGGDKWKTDVTGQIDYLWTELNSGYKTKVLTPMLALPNTVDGAMDAAEIFVRHFEIPSHMEENVARRRQYAKEYWDKVTKQVV